jgi:hypothetical protein
MSYENTFCPCGGKKLPDTMLCADCETAFADRRERQTMNDLTVGVELRRHAAIVLVSLARSRKRQPYLPAARLQTT